MPTSQVGAFEGRVVLVDADFDSFRADGSGGVALLVLTCGKRTAGAGGGGDGGGGTDAGTGDCERRGGKPFVNW